VGGDGDGRGAALRRHALEHEAVVVERCQDGIAAAGHAAQRRAFDDLRHMLCRTYRKACHRRKRGKDCGVAGAPGDDRVYAGGKRLSGKASGIVLGEAGGAQAIGHQP
jgi:hypothetical protein